jgi:hypothetical protein
MAILSAAGLAAQHLKPEELEFKCEFHGSAPANTDYL